MASLQLTRETSIRAPRGGCRAPHYLCASLLLPPRRTKLKQVWGRAVGGRPPSPGTEDHQVRRHLRGCPPSGMLKPRVMLQTPQRFSSTACPGSLRSPPVAPTASQSQSETNGQKASTSKNHHMTPGGKLSLELIKAEILKLRTLGIRKHFVLLLQELNTRFRKWFMSGKCIPLLRKSSSISTGWGLSRFLAFTKGTP